MTVRDDRREAAIERMADHLLAEGLAAATLRPLAAAAGTSDRMLLYYFTDRNDLLAATLDRVAERMTTMLDAAIPIGPRRPFPLLLKEVWTAMASENLKPFMPLWLELASGSARGLQPHRDVAGRIAEGFFAWIAARLASDADNQASLFFAAIEGMYLLTAIGRIATADGAAAELASLFQTPCDGTL